MISYVSFATFSVVAGLLTPRPDIVIASVLNPGTDIAGVVIAWLRSTRCVVELRDFMAESLQCIGYSPRGILVVIADLYTRMVCRLADAITVPHRSMAEVLCRRGVSAERVLLLPHAADRTEAADPEALRTIRSAYDPGGYFLALYAGGFNRYYGLDVLVEAARLLEARRMRIKLVLLGTGTERARMEQILRDESLHTLALAGPVAPDNVPPYLQAADLLIACLAHTMYEVGSGYLLTKECQYLLAGKPILAIEDKPRLKLILDSIEAGEGVAHGDAEGIINALRWHAEHPAEAARRGRNAREYAMQHLLRDNIVGAFEQQLRAQLRVST